MAYAGIECESVSKWSVVCADPIMSGPTIDFDSSSYCDWDVLTSLLTAGCSLLDLGTLCWAKMRRRVSTCRECVTRYGSETDILFLDLSVVTAFLFVESQRRIRPGAALILRYRDGLLENGICGWVHVCL